MGGNNDGLVLIGVAHDEVEASIWRDVLDADGIAVLMRSIDPLASFGVPPLPGSVRVFVRAQDEKRARWLLGELAGSDEAPV